jgi:hypothetical protein
MRFCFIILLLTVFSCNKKYINADTVKFKHYSKGKAYKAINLFYNKKYHINKKTIAKQAIYTDKSIGIYSIRNSTLHPSFTYILIKHSDHYIFISNSFNKEIVERELDSFLNKYKISEDDVDKIKSKIGSIVNSNINIKESGNGSD